MDKKLIFKIGQNTLWQLLAKVVTTTSTLVITIIATRQLGVTGYGNFMKAFSLVTPFYMVVDFGLNATVLKLFVGQRKPSLILSQLFGLRTTTSLLLIGLISLVTVVLPHYDGADRGFSPLVKVAILILSLTILFQSVFLSANSFFQYQLRYDRSLMATLVGSLMSVLAVALLTAVKPNLLFLVMGYTAGSAALAGASYLLLKERVGVIRPSFNLASWQQLLAKTWPIGLALIVNLIYFRADALILALVRPTSEVAVYGLAYRIFEVSLVLPVFMVNALYPVLLVLVKDKRQFFQTCVRTVLGLGLTAILVASFIILTANQLVILVGGVAFGGAVLALKILALGLPFFYVSALLMWLLVVFERQRTLIFVYGLGGLFNVISNLILIPQFGYLAAAVTTGLSELLVFLTSFILVIAAWRRFQTAPVNGKISN